MNDSLSAFDAPEPRGLGKRAERAEIRPALPHGEQKIEAQEGRGREIAMEAMKEDKRIWMRRSGGKLEQVFVIDIFEDDAQCRCCWVQPDGSVLAKRRSFTEIVQDQAAAETEGEGARSEAADAYALVENLRHAREEKGKMGVGRNRIEPLHIFDTKTGKFFQIEDDIDLNMRWSGDVPTKDFDDPEDPFLKMQVKLSDPESYDRRTIDATPMQFVRDQIWCFRNEHRRSPEKEEGIEDHIRRTRKLEALNDDAQRKRRWDFEDIIRKESTYSGKAAVNGIYVSVAYIKKDRMYELYMDYDDESKRTPESYHENVRINDDWDLSKKDAESVFLFAKAQLEAGEDLANVFKKAEAFVRSLKKDS